MNFKNFALAGLLALSAGACESSGEVSIPMFPDGGLLRTGTPLTRGQLYLFEGMYNVAQGTKLLGPGAAVRTSKGTVSVLTDKNNGFSVLGSACLPDRRVVVEGYWQYPTELEAGLVRLYVDPPELAEKLCDGEAPKADTTFSLNGAYGEGDDFPTLPLSLTWQHELKEWRGRFANTAHHGACEGTDHCGASPNSLESIRLAERIGSNVAEVDVRTTRDGIPVMFHDPGLSRSLVRGMFCNGAVADLSLAELLGSCEYRYGEKIPTLATMLDFMVNETELEGAYLDMKVPEAVLPAARQVAALNDKLAALNSDDDLTNDRMFRAAIAITTDEVRTAWHDAKTQLQKEGITVPACLLEYDPNLVLTEGCIAWGPTWTEGPQADNVQMVREHGVITIFWTINQSEFIDDFLIEAKPNGIITARAATLFYRYQTIGTVPPRPGDTQ
jgi:glycerophosphoryl diester phosphodiesterase